MKTKQENNQNTTQAEIKKQVITKKKWWNKRKLLILAFILFVVPFFTLINFNLNEAHAHTKTWLKNDPFGRKYPKEGFPFNGLDISGELIIGYLTYDKKLDSFDGDDDAPFLTYDKNASHHLTDKVTNTKINVFIIMYDYHGHYGFENNTDDPTKTYFAPYIRLTITAGWFVSYYSTGFDDRWALWT